MRIEPRANGAPLIRVNNRADLVNAIAMYEQIGARHRIPLLRALLHGRIGFFECQRSTSRGAVKRFMAGVEKPALLLLGDDDYTSTGPIGWPGADRAMRWARGVLIHGTGATPEQYEEVVDATVALRRVVLVEADSAHADEWAQLAEAQPNRAGVLVLKPTGAGQHPVLPAVRQ